MGFLISDLEENYHITFSQTLKASKTQLKTKPEVKVQDDKFNRPAMLSKKWLYDLNLVLTHDDYLSIGLKIFVYGPYTTIPIPAFIFQPTLYHLKIDDYCKITLLLHWPIWNAYIKLPIEPIFIRNTVLWHGIEIILAFLQKSEYSAQSSLLYYSKLYV